MFNKFSKKIYIILAVIVGIITVCIASWIWYFSATDKKNGIPTHFISYEFAHSRPEGTLYYPNAHLLSLNGMGQHMTETGWGGAWSGAILTSNDSPEKIYEWYDNWVKIQGWHESKQMEAIHISTQLSSKDYIRGTRETFSVAMNDPKQLGWTIGKQLPSNTTIFEISYYIKPN